MIHFNTGTLPVLSIRPTPDGPVLCLAGRWRREFERIPEVQTAAGLEVSSFEGEYEQRLEFLGSLPPLRYFGSLYSFPFDYGYLYGLDTLKSLKFLTLRESSIDFHRFPNLESAVVPWHAGLDTIFECRRLRALSLLGYRGNNSSKFAPLSSLAGFEAKGLYPRRTGLLPGNQALATSRNRALTKAHESGAAVEM